MEFGRHQRKDSKWKMEMCLCGVLCEKRNVFFFGRMVFAILRCNIKVIYSLWVIWRLFIAIFPKIAQLNINTRMIALNGRNSNGRWEREHLFWLGHAKRKTMAKAKATLQVNSKYFSQWFHINSTIWISFDANKYVYYTERKIHQINYFRCLLKPNHQPSPFSSFLRPIFKKRQNKTFLFLSYDSIPGVRGPCLCLYSNKS